MDRQFSINSIALGNIRRRRGRYLLLIAGIVLAIYFVATALLFADTMFTSLRERHYNRLGEQDAIVFDCGKAPLEELISTGIFSEYGTAEILGYVLPDGQNQENGFSVARFEDTALNLARQEPLEGRLPEKAGEIALEQSALARLRTESGVEDTITLTLLIPDGTGFMNTPVQKSYILVGILTDKLIYLNQWDSAVPAYRDYPAGVLAADEQIEPGGRAVVNCYGCYVQGDENSWVDLYDFFIENDIDNQYGLVEDTSYQLFSGRYNTNESSIITTSVFFMVIAVVLVCAACLGIINAFSADLASRKRQIGLFRAVGATQRQIRAIFGREVILIALCSIPSGLALAGLTVWAVTGVLGESYTFRPNAFVIAVVAAAGVLCVSLAAAIPLRKAAKIPPMQAIRDVELTRRLKRSRIESSPLFDVPRHIARRNITLYQNRQLGITAMLAVSIVLLSFVAFAAKPILSEAGWDSGCDYVLRTRERMHDWLMEYGLHRPGITEQDRADAAALATVKTVTGEKRLGVKLLTEKITPYFTTRGFGFFDYLFPEPQRSDMLNDPFWREELARQHHNYLESKAKYGYNQDYLTVDCCATDAQAVNKLTPFVSAGRINIDRLNAGEEILLIAPAEYGFIQEKLGDGGWSMQIYYELDNDTTYSAVYQNDMFQVGDTITVSLLYTDSAIQYNDDGSFLLPEDAVRIDRTVTIGAILEPYTGGKYIPCSCDILTTIAGLDALGFGFPYYTALAVTLSESPDAAMEEYLEINLARIAAGAVLLLFFAICTSMINNALSARIRAGRREIGTLRAVGASGRVITRSYLWQLLSMFTWGTVTGLAVELALCGWLLTKEHIATGGASLPLWPPLLFVALLFGICLLNVRSKVGGIFKGSIVENIREL
jgi:cell division protein FtsX